MAAQTYLSPRSRLSTHPGPDSPSSPPQADGVRDTIESIILALIFAFVFRAFVVEAFIIPTGSMAPGLYGEHIKQRCELCGYPFAVGIVQGMSGQIKCPNCSHYNDGRLKPADSPIRSDPGDRILVLKWPYDIGGSLLGPKRWDVVVFKDPEDGETNFIKRLLGLPGEVLQIIDGDVYTTPISAVRQDIREALSRPPPPDNPRFRRLSNEQQEALARSLRIDRKPRAAQDSLWMIHYDHDYRPDLSLVRESPSFQPPTWQPRDSSQIGVVWEASSPVVRCTPRDDRETWLDLKGKPIQDHYGYNKTPDSSIVMTAPRDVGDVLLRFVVTPLARDGDLLLFLRKGTEEFKITLSTDGTVLPTKRSGERGLPIALTHALIEPLRADIPLTVEFENVDYRVALRINGDEVWATTDADYAPNIAKLLAAASDQSQARPLAQLAIGSRGLPLEIRHLTVHRDVYYRSDTFPILPGIGPGRSESFAGYPGWGTERNPILLRASPPDYFCCGDNSPQSKDSRFWWKVCPGLAAKQGEESYQFGTVPGDQMIGRAFFVYWPNGLRFSQATPAVIPNVGMMRIIR